MSGGEQRLHDDERLRFFGTVVAAQCHEVVNVLNILNEVAGLIDDLAGASAVDTGRVQALAQKIQAQIQRGQGLVRSISRFAHSTDASVAVIDVAELLREATDLVERPVRLAGSTLRLQLPAAPAVIESCPFALVRLVFSAVELWLQPTPATVVIRLLVEDDGLLFEVDREGELCELDAMARQHLAWLGEQVQALGGTLRGSPPAQAARIAFHVPARAPQGLRERAQ